MTDTNPIESSRVALAVEDGTEMSAYVSYPASVGPRPGIMLFHDAFGVNHHLRALADRYAGLGFAAIAPELFHRTSPGFERSALVLDEVMPIIESLTTEGLVADASAAYNWLASAGGASAERVAAVGFCMGGRTTFIVNGALPLAAAICYYGGGIAPALLDVAPSLHGPHLFIWGGEDSGIPPQQRRAVADALHAAGRQFVDVVFSGCNHGFSNEGWPERYNPAAARQSWALGSAFLEDALGVVLAR